MDPRSFTDLYTLIHDLCERAERTKRTNRGKQRMVVDSLTALLVANGGQGTARAHKPYFRKMVNAVVAIKNIMAEFGGEHRPITQAKILYGPTLTP